MTNRFLPGAELSGWRPLGAGRNRHGSEERRSTEVHDQCRCKSFVGELTGRCVHPSMQMSDAAPGES